MGARWQLPGYQVQELVGFGGSGEVWRARVEATGEVVALKRLHSADAVARERLRREAALLSSVAGQHVVRVRDVVMTDSAAVLVMDGYGDVSATSAYVGCGNRLECCWRGKFFDSLGMLYTLVTHRLVGVIS